MMLIPKYCVSVGCWWCICAVTTCFVYFCHHSDETTSTHTFGGTYTCILAPVSTAIDSYWYHMIADGVCDGLGPMPSIYRRCHGCYYDGHQHWWYATSGVSLRSRWPNHGLSTFMLDCNDGRDGIGSLWTTTVPIETVYGCEYRSGRCIDVSPCGSTQ